MPQLAQSLSLNLANAFTGDLKTAADFFQGMFRAIFHAEAHSEDLLLSRAEGAQYTGCSLPQVGFYDRLRRRNRSTIFDEVAETRICLGANWRLQRDWRSHNLESVANSPFRNVHLFGNLCGRGFASQGLHQQARSTNHFIDNLSHVDWEPDGARLIGKRSTDRLANPPRRVR